MRISIPHSTNQGYLGEQNLIGSLMKITLTVVTISSFVIEILGGLQLIWLPALYLLVLANILWGKRFFELLWPSA